MQVAYGKKGVFHKIVLFYWHEDNCVGHVPTAALAAHRRRGLDLEQPRVLRAERRGCVPLLRSSSRKSLLERAGAMRLGLGTQQCKRHPCRCSHVSRHPCRQSLPCPAPRSIAFLNPSPLFSHTLGASHVSQSSPWHMPCKRGEANTGLGLGSRRGLCTDA